MSTPIKVFEGEIIPDTDWLGTHTTIPEFICTAQYRAPEVNGELMNVSFALPMSAAFDKFPRKPRKVIVYVE